MERFASDRGVAMVEPGSRFRPQARTHVRVTTERAALDGVPPVCLVSVPLPVGYHALPPVERERAMRAALEQAAEVACQQAVEP
jgi:hypothetical protein